MLKIIGSFLPKMTDPVCNMSVNRFDANGGVYVFESTKYYFCGTGCNKAFQKEPKEYLLGNKKIDM